MTKEIKTYTIPILFSKSNFEILKLLQKKSEPIQFKELKFIKNPQTTKTYSTRTIAASLKELEEKGLIENQIIKNKTKKSLGYQLTNTGKKTYLILKETEEKLKKL